MKPSIFKAGACAVLLLVGPLPAQAGLQAWIVEWDSPAALEALRKHPQAFEGLSLFSYQFDDQGKLVPANPSLRELADSIRRAAPGTPLFLAVANDVGKKQKDGRFIARLLSTEKTRRQHIAELVKLCRDYDGLEIDYENLGADSRPAGRRNFTDFIVELRRQLAADKKLMVDIENRPKGMDWKTLSQSADRLNLMAYYSHWDGSGPGALCEFTLLEAAAAELKTQGIPPDKVRIVLPTYGFDWPLGKRGKQLESEDAETLRQENGGPPVRRDAERNPSFDYRDDQGSLHTVCYEDAASLKAKTDKLREGGFTHIGLWRLGKGPVPGSL